MTIAANEKLGDVILEKDKATCRALWRPSDGSADVLLCTMNLRAYERHATLREAFAVLAADIAINLNQPAGSTIVVRHVPVQRPAEAKLDRTGFACWSCTRPQAAAARQWLSSYSDADLAA